MTQLHRGPMTSRTVLVTGATGGIGKATALGLAAMGAHLAITGRDPGRTAAAASEIRAAGGRPVDVFVADLSAQSEVRRLVLRQQLTDEVLGTQPRRGPCGTAVAGECRPGRPGCGRLTWPAPRRRPASAWTRGHAPCRCSYGG
jgi:hypothetical protein